jgi:hypothetical protein
LKEAPKGKTPLAILRELKKTIPTTNRTGTEAWPAGEKAESLVESYG